MRTLSVPLELAEALVKYLAQRPYGEVANLMQELVKSPVVETNPPGPNPSLNETNPALEKETDGASNEPNSV